MSTVVKSFRSALTQLQSSAEQSGRTISKTQLAAALNTLEGKKLSAAERTQVQNALKRASLSDAAREIADGFFDKKTRARRNDGDSFKDQVVKVRADLPEDRKPGKKGGPGKPDVVKVRMDVPEGGVYKKRADEPVVKIRADDPTPPGKPPVIVKVMADIPQKVRADEPTTPGKPPVIVKVMADIPQKVRADEPTTPERPPVIVKVMADIPDKIRADEPSEPSHPPVVNKIRADDPVVKIAADEPSGPSKPPVVNKVRADEPNS